MFYQEKAIKSLIICPVCDTMYSDPRFLTCGNTMCNQCILKLANGYNNDQPPHLQCTLCQNTHTVPADGFPQNLLIARLISEKPNEVYRSPIVKCFKTKLNAVREKTDELEKCIDNGADQIKEYCRSLRNEIELETKQCIEKMQRFSQELVDRVNHYEASCIANYEENRTRANEASSLFLKEVNKFHAEKSEYLARFEIDDEEIVEILNRARDYLIKLKLESNGVKKLKFNAKLLEFKRNRSPFDAGVIGEFSARPLSFEDDKLRCLPLSWQHIRDHSSHMTAFQLTEREIVHFYVDFNGFVNVSHYDLTTSAVLNEKNNLLDKLEVNELKVVQFGGGYALYIKKRFDYSTLVINGHSVSINSSNYHLLVLIDAYFKYTCHAEFQTDIQDIAANKSNVFVLEAGPKKQLLIYSSKLELITKPFTYSIPSNPIYQMVVNEESLFFCYHAVGSDLKVRILSLSTGVARKEFKVDAGRLKLIGNDYLVLFNAGQRKVQVYDLNDEFSLLEELSFSKLGENLSLCADSNGFMGFFEPNSFYYFE